MTVVGASEITKRLFIWAVTLVVVAPRMPLDPSGWTTLGGSRLTRNFRRLLLIVVALNFLRLALSQKDRTAELTLYSDVLGVFEVVALTFMVFLVPYMLIQSLKGRINIPPIGRQLSLWLVLAGILSAMGVILSRTVDARYWCLKKISNVVSAFPILSALRTYNGIVSPHNGRGHVMGQTLKYTEYVHFVLQMLSAIGYLAVGNDFSSDQLVEIFDALRTVAFAADWMRILVHGIFLNHVDEMTQLHPFSGRGDDNDDVPLSSTTSTAPSSGGSGDSRDGLATIPFAEADEADEPLLGSQALSVKTSPRNKRR